jgi:hypothetical protein
LVNGFCDHKPERSEMNRPIVCLTNYSKKFMEEMVNISKILNISRKFQKLN